MCQHTNHNHGMINILSWDRNVKPEEIRTIAAAAALSVSHWHNECESSGLNNTSL
jgi:hypothetical protein